MHFLIIFLCLKREEQGKLLSDSSEYTNNNGDIKKRVGNNLYSAEDIKKKDGKKSLLSKID